MNKIVWIVILTYLIMGLTACSNSPDSDVIEFVDRTKRKESKLQELPEFKRPVPYFYDGSNKRDPFSEKISFKKTVIKRDVRSNYTGPLPDFKRKKEVLEEYTLDELSMVGVLEKDGKYWALIKDSTGIVHRVGVGNFLGQNYGRITSIDDSGLSIDELVPDGEGGWVERKGFMKMK